MRELQLRVAHRSEDTVDGKVKRLVSFEVFADNEALTEMFDVEVSEAEFGSYALDERRELVIGRELSTIDFDVDPETLAKLTRIADAVGMSLDKVVEHILVDRLISEALRAEGLPGGARFVPAPERPDFRSYLETSEALGQDPLEGPPTEDEEDDE
jgi:hypothetical protein